MISDTDRATGPAPSREEVFARLVWLLERSGRALHTSAFTLDDQPFSVHGLDSLTLVRLSGDVERMFGIELDDADALLAFSFTRLVDLILRRLEARSGSRQPAAARVNFLDAVLWRSAAAPDSVEVRRRIPRQDDVIIHPEHLLRIAAHTGGAIPERVDERPQVVLIAASDPLTTLLGFLAALTVEALPLVLPRPKALGGAPAYLRRIHQLAAQLGNRPVVALEPGLLPDTTGLAGLPIVDLPGDVLAAPAVRALPPPSSRCASGDDVAFLQMTSASTGDAKLVAITHANICANLEAMVTNLSLSAAQDRTCTWMPLYHDMGLIGGTLFPLYGGFSTILMRANDFIKNPAAWVHTLDELRVTFTGAPNFAVDYAATALSDADLEGTDLSSVRRFGLAAEPIHRATVQRWLDRFGPFGFRADAFVPGLGLAESTLSTTTRPGREPRYVLVGSAGAVVGERVNVLGRGVCTYPAVPAPRLPEGERGVAVLSLGTPLAGLTVDLRDADGIVIHGDHRVGEICIGGSSVAGYYDPSSGTPLPVADGVLRSGDLGFFDGGELFVLERMKNVVIRNGVNHIASLLEQQVADLFGVFPHTVMIVDGDIHNPGSPVYAVLEAADQLPAPEPRQRAALRSLDLPIDVVAFARGFALPRTTSGKKQYHRCRAMLASGKLDIAQQIDLR